MGRPRIYDEPRVATAIRLPQPLRDQLVAIAADQDVSVNHLVTQAVRAYVADPTDHGTRRNGPRDPVPRRPRPGRGRATRKVRS